MKQGSCWSTDASAASEDSVCLSYRNGFGMTAHCFVLFVEEQLVIGWLSGP